jgi:hypothetical protein
MNRDANNNGEPWSYFNNDDSRGEIQQGGNKRGYNSFKKMPFNKGNERQNVNERTMIADYIDQKAKPSRFNNNVPIYPNMQQGNMNTDNRPDYQQLNPVQRGQNVYNDYNNNKKYDNFNKKKRNNMTGGGGNNNNMRRNDGGNNEMRPGNNNQGGYPRYNNSLHNSQRNLDEYAMGNNQSNQMRKPYMMGNNNNNPPPQQNQYFNNNYNAFASLQQNQIPSFIPQSLKGIPFL